MELIKKYNRQLLIVVIGVLFFLPYLGNVHLFDWDEINFAEAAREMIVTGDYLNVRIDFVPFHEKPPLFIWLQATSMHIFGINEFAARLPNAIIGIISLIFLYEAGKRIFDEMFGLFWVLVYIGSILPHFYFKTAIIDPLFNLFMFSGIYYIFRYYTDNLNLKHIIFASLLIAGAVMTKGPVGFLLPTLSWLIFIILQRKIYKYPFKEFAIYTIISLVPASIWYLLIFLNSDSGLISDFISYQIRLLTTGDAGHSGPIYYHFVVLLIGCFPASVLILRAFRNINDDTEDRKTFKLLNIILLSVVLVIFSLVKTKIVHYSSLAYFPITYLATITLYYTATSKIKWKLSSTILLAFIGLIFSLLLFWFPIIIMNIDLFLPRIDDEFTREVLKSNVHWNGNEWVIGLVYFIGLLISLILISRDKLIRGFLFLFGSSALSIFLILPILAPKIEAYTQNAPIEFYNSLLDKDVYIHNIGFKSYAPYFYGQRKLENSPSFLKMNPNEYEQYLLEGDINKDVYLVAKLDKGQELLATYSDLVLIRIKNGFVFMERKKKLFK
ncbi:MAG TPA: glycosyltransferase family 39 protein [Candidatus Kapabacteria bacterium]|nr:glycosyltransferase family 39 protein [Candidatus Kapabacteria bacterium]